MLKIVDSYMGLIPLWDYFMKIKFREDMTSDSGAKTITNSHVECYFGIIKARMLRKIRYSAPEFLNKQYIMIKGLCNEVEIKVPKKRRQEIPDIEKWKRTKKFVKMKNPLKYVKCPTYGRTHMYNGLQITLTDTCHLDNLLMIYCTYLSSGKINGCGVVGKVLARWKTLSISSSWEHAKIIWCEQVLCKIIDGPILFDLYGTEYERFVKHIGEIQGMHSTVTCANHYCPEGNLSHHMGVS